MAGGAVLALPRPIWMGIDAGIVYLGLRAGYAMLPWRAAEPAAQVPMWKAWVTISAALVLSGLIVGLYERSTLLVARRWAVRSLLAIGLAMLVGYVAIIAVMYSELSRRVVAWVVGVYVPAGLGLRAAGQALASCCRRGLLLVGTGRSVRETIEAIGKAATSGYEVVGVVATDSQAGRWVAGRPVLGGIADLPALCSQHEVKVVVVGSEEQRRPEVMEAALSCLRLGCRVTNKQTFYEKTFGQVAVDHIDPGWFLYADLGVYRDEAATLKRAFDLVMSLAGLVLSLPLWPMIALAIKLDGRGPVLHRQQRVGQAGQPFVLYKFRTMHVGAEPNGSVWASRDDPRITRVGRVLRRTRLDELPQLWNVLHGQMSLVGPRPERPDFVRALARTIPYYDERHLVKPGLTGWAQINFRYGCSVADARKKLQLDLYYIKHMSLELDLVILFRTLGLFFCGAV